MGHRESRLKKLNDEIPCGDGTKHAWVYSYLAYALQALNGEPLTVLGSQQREPKCLRPRNPTVGKNKVFLSVTVSTVGRQLHFKYRPLADSSIGLLQYLCNSD